MIHCSKPINHHPSPNSIPSFNKSTKPPKRNPILIRPANERCPPCPLEALAITCHKVWSRRWADWEFTISWLKPLATPFPPFIYLLNGWSQEIAPHPPWYIFIVHSNVMHRINDAVARSVYRACPKATCPMSR
ncbi:hypothetical protein JTE90_022238 [Oedothorax gibbosus]|uniref:Uncharacterized protein n=1 Tax=Oedothorax gibbosus TaxID=931172 RepID=A0AAV6VX23_9ARAC|nr:hypothetical protein JTE90_022238 [Oedothorax gibbosus]